MNISKLFHALLLGCSWAASSYTHATTINVENLASSPYWLKLGHYLPTTFSGYRSTIDSDAFFLSPNGKDSPYEELNATIEALYSEDKNRAQETRCAFPARFTWLQKQQGLPAALDCSELNTWRDVLDPEGLTLVFPTAFMNNPSSMFGHTLLRVDAKDQTRHKELVAFAINFAAEPDVTDNAALYALKGLVGSYPGKFTVMPYYRKVREYNDIESRDIWEYKLTFNEEEVERVLLHLWEMQLAEFDYYFIDENCSYQLLALLELARDDLQLVEHFPLHAIPSDTVEVLSHAGLIQAPNYRASFGTRLLHQANSIDPSLFQAVEEAKLGHFPNKDEYSDAERAAILELAYEWLNFELYDLGLERDVTAKRLTSLLYQRSLIKVESPFEDVTAPAISPEKGHSSARAGIGYEHNQALGNKIVLEWRAAYHDLLDAQQGFIPGAKISFLDTQLSVDEQGTTRLDRLYLIDSMALAPSNKVFESVAWNIRAGSDRQPMGTKLAQRWFAQGGYGKAVGNPYGLHMYGLLSGMISGGELTQYDASFAAGIEAGITYQLSDNQRVAMEGELLAHTAEGTSHSAELALSWHWQPKRNFALRGQLGYQHWQGEDVKGKVTSYFYF